MAGEQCTKDDVQYSELLYDFDEDCDEDSPLIFYLRLTIAMIAISLLAVFYWIIEHLKAQRPHPTVSDGSDSRVTDSGSTACETMATSSVGRPQGVTRRRQLFENREYEDWDEICGDDLDTEGDAILLEEEDQVSEKVLASRTGSLWNSSPEGEGGVDVETTDLKADTDGREAVGKPLADEGELSSWEHLGILECDPELMQMGKVLHKKCQKRKLPSEEETMSDLGCAVLKESTCGLEESAVPSNWDYNSDISAFSSHDSAPSPYLKDSSDWNCEVASVLRCSNSGMADFNESTAEQISLSESWKVGSQEGASADSFFGRTRKGSCKDKTARQANAVQKTIECVVKKETEPATRGSEAAWAWFHSGRDSRDRRILMRSQIAGADDAQLSEEDWRPNAAFVDNVEDMMDGLKLEQNGVYFVPGLAEPDAAASDVLGLYTAEYGLVESGCRSASMKLELAGENSVDAYETNVYSGGTTCQEFDWMVPYGAQASETFVQSVDGIGKSAEEIEASYGAREEGINLNVHLSAPKQTSCGEMKVTSSCWTAGGQRNADRSGAAQAAATYAHFDSNMTFCRPPSHDKVTAAYDMFESDIERASFSLPVSVNQRMYEEKDSLNEWKRANRFGNKASNKNGHGVKVLRYTNSGLRDKEANVGLRMKAAQGRDSGDITLPVGSSPTGNKLITEMESWLSSKSVTDAGSGETGSVGTDKWDVSRSKFRKSHSSKFGSQETESPSRAESLKSEPQETKMTPYTNVDDRQENDDAATSPEATGGLLSTVMDSLSSVLYRFGSYEDSLADARISEFTQDETRLKMGAGPGAVGDERTGDTDKRGDASPLKGDKKWGRSFLGGFEEIASSFPANTELFELKGTEMTTNIVSEDQQQGDGDLAVVVDSRVSTDQSLNDLAAMLRREGEVGAKLGTLVTQPLLIPIKHSQTDDMDKSQPKKEHSLKFGFEESDAAVTVDIARMDKREGSGDLTVTVRSGATGGSVSTVVIEGETPECYQASDRAAFRAGIGSGTIRYAQTGKTDKPKRKRGEKDRSMKFGSEEFGSSLSTGEEPSELKDIEMVADIAWTDKREESDDFTVPVGSGIAGDLQSVESLPASKEAESKANTASKDIRTGEVDKSESKRCKKKERSMKFGFEGFTSNLSMDEEPLELIDTIGTVDIARMDKQESGDLAVPVYSTTGLAGSIRDIWSSAMESYSASQKEECQTGIRLCADRNALHAVETDESKKERSMKFGFEEITSSLSTSELKATEVTGGLPLRESCPASEEAEFKVDIESGAIGDMHTGEVDKFKSKRGKKKGRSVKFDSEEASVMKGAEMMSDIDSIQRHRSNDVTVTLGSGDFWSSVMEDWSSSVVKLGSPAPEEIVVSVETDKSYISESEGGSMGSSMDSGSEQVTYGLLQDVEMTMNVSTKERRGSGDITVAADSISTCSLLSVVRDDLSSAIATFGSADGFPAEAERMSEDNGARVTTEADASSRRKRGKRKGCSLRSDSDGISGSVRGSMKSVEAAEPSEVEVTVNIGNIKELHESSDTTIVAGFGLLSTVMNSLSSATAQFKTREDQPTKPDASEPICEEARRLFRASAMAKQEDKKEGALFLKTDSVENASELRMSTESSGLQETVVTADIVANQRHGSSEITVTLDSGATSDVFTMECWSSSTRLTSSADYALHTGISEPVRNFASESSVDIEADQASRLSKEGVEIPSVRGEIEKLAESRGKHGKKKDDLTQFDSEKVSFVEDSVSRQLDIGANNLYEKDVARSLGGNAELEKPFKAGVKNGRKSQSKDLGSDELVPADLELPRDYLSAGDRGASSGEKLEEKSESIYVHVHRIRRHCHDDMTAKMLADALTLQMKQWSSSKVFVRSVGHHPSEPGVADEQPVEETDVTVDIKADQRLRSDVVTQTFGYGTAAVVEGSNKSGRSRRAKKKSHSLKSDSGEVALSLTVLDDEDRIVTSSDTKWDESLASERRKWKVEDKKSASGPEEALVEALKYTEPGLQEDASTKVTLDIGADRQCEYGNFTVDIDYAATGDVAVKPSSMARDSRRKRKPVAEEEGVDTGDLYSSLVGVSADSLPSVGLAESGLQKEASKLSVDSTAPRQHESGNLTSTQRKDSTSSKFLKNEPKDSSHGMWKTTVENLETAAEYVVYDTATQSAVMTTVAEPAEASAGRRRSRSKSGIVIHLKRPFEGEDTCGEDGLGRDGQGRIWSNVTNEYFSLPDVPQDLDSPEKSYVGIGMTPAESVLSANRTDMNASKSSIGYTSLRITDIITLRPDGMEHQVASSVVPTSGAGGNRNNWMFTDEVHALRLSHGGLENDQKVAAPKELASGETVTMHPMASSAATVMEMPESQQGAIVSSGDDQAESQQRGLSMRERFTLFAGLDGSESGTEVAGAGGVEGKPDQEGEVIASAGKRSKHGKKKGKSLSGQSRSDQEETVVEKQVSMKTEAEDPSRVTTVVQEVRLSSNRDMHDSRTEMTTVVSGECLTTKSKITTSTKKESLNGALTARSFMGAQSQENSILTRDSSGSVSAVQCYASKEVMEHSETKNHVVREFVFNKRAEYVHSSRRLDDSSLKDVHASDNGKVLKSSSAEDSSGQTMSEAPDGTIAFKEVVNQPKSKRSRRNRKGKKGGDQVPKEGAEISDFQTGEWIEEENAIVMTVNLIRTEPIHSVTLRMVSGASMQSAVTISASGETTLKACGSRGLVESGCSIERSSSTTSSEWSHMESAKRPKAGDLSSETSSPPYSESGYEERVVVRRDPLEGGDEHTTATEIDTDDGSVRGQSVLSYSQAKHRLASNSASMDVSSRSSLPSSGWKHQRSSILEVIGVLDVGQAVNRLTTLNSVSEVMRRAGLESSNLIFGIDYTASNKYQGEKTFGGRSLHSIQPTIANPYQQVIAILGRTLEPFNSSGFIAAYGFGDVKTSDASVFPLNAYGQCKNFEEVLDAYNKVTPDVILCGPTNFAPLIYEAINICKIEKSYHILVIVADGQVTNERATREAIMSACKYPLSIIVVGVGDGPWEMMRVFDDSLPRRQWDNFHFVDFHDVIDRSGKPESAFALECLLEIPDQYMRIKELKLLEFEDY